jgi:hypothetical protein
MSDGFGRAAERTAITINRRRFLRKVADSLFTGMAVAATGAGWSTILSSVANATDASHCAGQSDQGPGCPGANAGYPCGPSRCCNYTTGHAGCDCGRAGAKCKTNSENSNCYSKDLREYSVDGCWTCNNAPCISGSKIVTTCCDCRTSAARCNDRDLGGGYGRCIAHSKTTVSCG